MTSDGRAIRCETCGGHFPLATLSARAACPYCGAEVRLDVGPAQEAREYQGDFFAEMRGADHDRKAVASWDRHSDTSSSKVWLGLLAVMVLAPTLSSVAGALSPLLPLPDALAQAAGGLASSCGVGLMFVAVAGYLVWMARGTRSAAAGRRVGSASRVACPHCGGPNELAPGQPLQSCTYCRGALVPSRTVMQRGLDEARLERRRAALSRYAAERRGMLGLQRRVSGYQKLMPLFFLVPCAPMIVGVCALPLHAASTEHSALEYACIGGPLLLVFGLVAAGAAWWLARKRGRRQSWRGALDDLALQFAGRSTEELADFMAWLEASWAGPYDTRFLGGGPRWGAALANAWGYRVAMVLNPEAPPSAVSPTYARVALAAWIPSASDGGPPPALGVEAQRTIELLKQAGFLVSCEEAGILAMAQQSVVTQLQEHPASAHQLAPVVGLLARLAHEIGAVPV